jgi:signal transduction histidine kinase
MHDDLGSGLSKIALLTQVMKQHVEDAKSKDELDKISESAQESLEKMSEIVWSLNPKNDKLQNLISYIRKFAMEYFEPTNITCKVNLPDEIPNTEMKGEQRRNVFLSVKEALHNVQKHSSASLVELSFVKKDNHGEIIIHDNGRGIDEDQLNRFGNGLQNMKQRMQSAGGYFTIESKEGTTVRLGYQLA